MTTDAATNTIDIAMTATLRPELLERTLTSFEPMFAQHDGWRLIINIDPAGPGSLSDILRLIEARFTNLTIREPSAPDFRAAWKWCVSQLRSEYVFWLEDDWELIADVDFRDMRSIMDETPALATLRLPRWPSEQSTFRQWNKRKLYGWNGRYFQIPDENIFNTGYSNNPSLTRRSFLQPVLSVLAPDLDPEKQISGFNAVVRGWVASWNYGVYQRPNSPAIVRDIGEEWRKRHRFGKGDKMQFKTWE